jgi:hypothetical protein
MWRKQGAAEEQHRLISWLIDNRICLDPTLDQAKVDPLSIKHGPNFANLNESAAKPSLTGAGIKLGTMNIFSNFQVECDEDIKRSFGYASEDFAFPGGWAANGFLPWGAEVIASIASEDHDVLSYIRDMAVAFHNSGAQPNGVKRACCQRAMSVVHKNGMILHCSVFNDVIESVTPDGVLLVGVSLHFFLSPSSRLPVEVSAVRDIGPWPTPASPAATHWLDNLLQWVDKE